MERMSVKDRMEAKLRAALAPVTIEIVDESRLHAGHLEAGDATETHFRVKIVASAFARRSQLDRHRMVNGVLADELASGVHALSIEARAPNE